MYCILVYDVQQRRVSKVAKLLKKYLNWVQNSVFEGELSESELYKLKTELDKKINKDKDSFIFFTFDRPKWIKREIIGIEKSSISEII